jgi:hypothetical protein
MTDMTPSPSAFARNAPTCCRTAPRPQRRWPWRPPWPSHPTRTAVASPGSDTITRARRHAASSPALPGPAGCSPRSSGAHGRHGVLVAGADHRPAGVGLHRPSQRARPSHGRSSIEPGSASAATAGKRWMLLSLEHPDLDGDSYPSRPAGTTPPHLSRVRPRRPCPPLAPAWSALGPRTIGNRWSAADNSGNQMPTHCSRSRKRPSGSLQATVPPGPPVHLPPVEGQHDRAARLPRPGTTGSEVRSAMPRYLQRQRPWPAATCASRSRWGVAPAGLPTAGSLRGARSRRAPCP